jgi:EAL and modified HD-GYP domain-containing signal transduction protein
MKDSDVLFCRKAVVNHNSETVAYHLLHPYELTSTENSTLLHSIFVDINLIEITQQKTIFIYTCIDNLTHLPMQHNLHLVVFIDSDSLSDKEHFDVLSDARLQGFQLGIINPDVNRLSTDFLTLFSYVHFSLDRCSTDHIIRYSQHSLLKHKKIWMNKIETEEQFITLKEAVSHGSFSGSFIKKITAIKGKTVLSYKSILVDLLTALNQNETSPRLLADYIERDPALTYRIIKLTNMAAYFNQFNVSSVQRAVEVIGIQDLIKWVSLIMLCSVSGKPASLVSMALTRAFFCQNMCSVLFPKLEGGFLVGLFSYLPSFFDEELPVLLKELPLEANIQSALLEYKGHLGSVLRIVEVYEAGHWEKIPFDKLANKNISKQTLKELYVESLKSAREMSAL